MCVCVCVCVSTHEYIREYISYLLFPRKFNWKMYAYITYPYKPF